MTPGVRAVITLRSEPHRGAVAATSPGLLIIGTARMPGQSHENRAVRAIIVVLVLFEPRCYLIVHLLIVLLGGIEDLGSGRGAVLAPEVISGTASCRGTGDPEQRVG
ncbi:hypothetical protein N8I77_004388 [Diaporthe amygdali]|uniref:Uncharacterized protein n=1 Tax=Phomopsis amygdali TaxID=1214568 RepID=A0AAD9W6Y1_PHOAM|nr:hypothetical protein N8I77_004388 [Diaporthe amygdali]